MDTLKIVSKPVYLDCFHFDGYNVQELVSWSHGAVFEAEGAVFLNSGGAIRSLHDGEYICRCVRGHYTVRTAQEIQERFNVVSFL